MTGANPVNVGGAQPPTPSLRRRLACFAYEGVLLFGVLFVSDYLFSSLTQQRHALQQRQAGMAFLFVVLGAYFVWFWSHGGQTLAMKTWHIRVVDAGGTPPRSGRALVRYAAAWLWFLPPLAMVACLGFARVGGGGTFAIVSAWLVGYAALSRILPGRQLPHDLLSGTRVLTAPPNR